MDVRKISSSSEEDLTDNNKQEGYTQLAADAETARLEIEKKLKLEQTESSAKKEERERVQREKIAKTEAEILKIEEAEK